MGEEREAQAVAGTMEVTLVGSEVMAAETAVAGSGEAPAAELEGLVAK
jgi:hypothetical protein